MSQREDQWGKMTLTARQAFMAMHCFLERYYQATHSDDVGGLLGGLSLLSGGSPADPAYQQEWLESVEKVIAAEETGGYHQADFRLVDDGDS
jgi:hypothetical protein